MKDITIDIPAGNGELARLAAALARQQVTLRAGAAVNAGRRMVARFIPSDLDAARRALDQCGVHFEEGDVVRVGLAPHPGELARLVQQLANGGVGVRALYLTSTSHNRLEIAVAATNLAQAVQALKAGGDRPASPPEASRPAGPYDIETI